MNHFFKEQFYVILWFGHVPLQEKVILKFSNWFYVHVTYWSHNFIYWNPIYIQNNTLLRVTIWVGPPGGLKSANM